MGVEIVFKSNLKEVMEKVDSTARTRMNQAVNAVRNEVLVTLAGSRSGRRYRVPETKVFYTASAPGEAPASATAELRQSISTEVEGGGKIIIGTPPPFVRGGRPGQLTFTESESSEKSVIGRVGTDKKHGLWMEFGTRAIAPRPWLRVSFEKSEAKVKELFTRLWFA